MKFNIVKISLILLILCQLYSCADIDNKSKQQEDGLNKYESTVLNLYNKYADDSLSLEDKSEGQLLRERRNWAGINYDIRLFLKIKKATIAKLDSVPNSRQQFTYKALRSYIINAGALNKNKVINDLGSPHDLILTESIYDNRDLYDKNYPYRMLQIDSFLSCGKYAYQEKNHN